MAVNRAVSLLCEIGAKHFSLETQKSNRIL